MVRPHQVHCWKAAPIQTALAMTWSWALPLRGRAQATGRRRTALDRGGGGRLSRECSRGGKASRASCCQCAPPGSGPCTSSSCNYPCSQVRNRPCTLSSCNCPCTSSSCNCRCSQLCNCTCASSSCNRPCPQACNCPHTSSRPSTSLALRCAACMCLNLCCWGKTVYSIMILVHIAAQAMQTCLKQMGSRLNQLFRGFWMTTGLRMWLQPKQGEIKAF